MQFNTDSTQCALTPHALKVFEWSDEEIDACFPKTAVTDAERYHWLREHPAWETESFLSDLSPTEFDIAVDKAMKEA